jgi:hypothetical protein
MGIGPGAHGIEHGAGMFRRNAHQHLCRLARFALALFPILEGAGRDAEEGGHFALRKAELSPGG